MSEYKNTHKHGTGGIVFASVLLIIIALISMIITFSALKKGNDVPSTPDNGTPDSGEVDNSQGGDEGGNENDDQSGDQNQNTPPKNTVISVPNTDIFKGPLLELSAKNPYRPTKELLTISNMNKLDPGQILTQYGFKNIYNFAAGNFIPANRQRFLDAEAIDAFCAMMEQYVTETGNKNIWLRNAYYYDISEDDKSTPDVNEALLNPHAMGLAVDLQINTANGQIPLLNSYPGYGRTNYYDWFLANCHKYGYIHTGNVENKYSTFRYIGLPHSTYVNTNYVSFDSYLDLIRTKTPDDRLVTVDSNGNEWWVYYVPASSGESTDIKVFGSQYTISGDNAGGFIVSVNTAGIR
ncbi:MAG: D-alanyl-D-alanine carboxypeptidase family protein [Ruminococcaceae bacterium]|nr:D-alanyl-D-alanine carboxypeptidase family protein [Oscillospiraceae bacterium]